MGVISGYLGGHYFTQFHVHRRLLTYLETVLALTTDTLHEKQIAQIAQISVSCANTVLRNFTKLYEHSRA